LCLVRVLASQKVVKLKRYLVLSQAIADDLVRGDIEPEFDSMLQGQIGNLLII
jgi:hypothetical protein